MPRLVFFQVGVFISAFLIFSGQLIMARELLPLFGGGVMVWGGGTAGAGVGIACCGGITAGAGVGGTFDEAARNCSTNSSGVTFPRALSHARPIELFRSGDGTSPVCFNDLAIES